MLVHDHFRFVLSTLDTESVFISFSVIMFAFGVIVIEVWDTQFYVWAFVLSLS